MYVNFDFKCKYNLLVYWAADIFPMAGHDNIFRKWFSKQIQHATFYIYIFIF